MPQASPILLPLLQQDGGPNIIVLLLPLLLIWFFLVIRPSSKEKKLQGAMRESLKKGDKVLTQAGVIAKVHAVQEGEVVLNLDGTAKMRVAKETVIRRLDEAKGKSDGARDGAGSKEKSAAG